MHVQLWKIDYSFFAALHSAKKRIYVVFTELYIIMVDRKTSFFAVLRSVKTRDYIVCHSNARATVEDRLFPFRRTAQC